MIAFNAYLERSRRELSKYILKKSNGLKLTILKIFKVLPVLQRANVKMPVPKVGRLPILSGCFYLLTGRCGIFYTHVAKRDTSHSALPVRDCQMGPVANHL